ARRWLRASAGEAARRHWSSLHRATETEQCFEEGDGARRRARGAALIRRHRLVALAFLRRLDHAALGLDRRQRAAVNVVDIATNLQLAGIVDERVLISQQHPDLSRQLDVLLAG